jgi:hypothetical protein
MPDKEKPQNFVKNLPQSNFIYNKSSMDYPVLELRPPQVRQLGLTT